MSTNDTNAQLDREIEDDVMNIPFIAWIGTISTIMIAVTVIVLTGIYYLTQRQENALRWEQADARVSDLEAQRAIDKMVVNGVYERYLCDFSQDRPKGAPCLRRHDQGRRVREVTCRGPALRAIAQSSGPLDSPRSSRPTR